MRQDLARKHLDRRLSGLKPVSDWSRPPRGWIRAIRDAIGMTAEQLATRIGVSQPRVMAIEKAEAHGSLTLQSLARAAEALDCTLVYALMPNESLDVMVRKQARAVADAQIERLDHTMRLENQGVSEEDLQEERERLADELLRGNLRRLWETL